MKTNNCQKRRSRRKFMRRKNQIHFKRRRGQNILMMNNMKNQKNKNIRWGTLRKKRLHARKKNKGIKVQIKLNLHLRRINTSRKIQLKKSHCLEKKRKSYPMMNTCNIRKKDLKGKRRKKIRKSLNRLGKNLITSRINIINQNKHQHRNNLEKVLPALIIKKYPSLKIRKLIFQRNSPLKVLIKKENSLNLMQALIKSLSTKNKKLLKRKKYRVVKVMTLHLSPKFARKL